MHILIYVLYVYLYVATPCIVLCKCQSVIPNQITTSTIYLSIYLSYACEDILGRYELRKKAEILLKRKSISV